MRINKFLAECGVGSRRACDKIIEEGRVKVNGKVCALGAEIDETKDSVSFDGKKLNKKIIRKRHPAQTENLWRMSFLLFYL